MEIKIKGIDVEENKLKCEIDKISLGIYNGFINWYNYNYPNLSKKTFIYEIEKSIKRVFGYNTPTYLKSFHNYLKNNLIDKIGIIDVYIQNIKALTIKFEKNAKKLITPQNVEITNEFIEFAKKEIGNKKINLLYIPTIYTNLISPLNLLTTEMKDYIYYEFAKPQIVIPAKIVLYGLENWNMFNKVMQELEAEWLKEYYNKIKIIKINPLVEIEIKNELLNEYWEQKIITISYLIYIALIGKHNYISVISSNNINETPYIFKEIYQLIMGK